MSERHLTTAEVAERMGVHPTTVRTWRSAGTGPAFIRDGQFIRYKLSDVEAYEEKNTVVPDADDGGL